IASFTCLPERSPAIAASTARMAVLNATHEIQTAPLCSALSCTCSCKCSRGTSASSMAIKCEVRDSHSRTNHEPHPKRNVRQLAKARSESVVSCSGGWNAVHTYGSLSLSKGNNILDSDEEGGDMTTACS